MTHLRLLARQVADEAVETNALASTEDVIPWQHAVADAVYTVFSTEYEKEIERLKAELDEQRRIGRMRWHQQDQENKELRQRAERVEAELASAKTGLLNAAADIQQLEAELATLRAQPERETDTPGLKQFAREQSHEIGSATFRAESTPVALAKDAVDQFVVFQLRNTIEDRHVPGVVEALEREWRQKRDALILAVYADHQEKAESAPVDQQRLVNRLLDLADFHHRMIPRYGPFHVEAEAVLREVVTKLTPHPAAPVDQQEIEHAEFDPDSPECQGCRGLDSTS